MKNIRQLCPFFSPAETKHNFPQYSKLLRPHVPEEENKSHEIAGRTRTPWENQERVTDLESAIDFAMIETPLSILRGILPERRSLENYTQTDPLPLSLSLSLSLPRVHTRLESLFVFCSHFASVCIPHVRSNRRQRPVRISDNTIWTRYRTSFTMHGCLDGKRKRRRKNA